MNHHGRIRTIGEDGEDLGEGELGETDVEKTKYLTLTVIFINRVQKILRMQWKCCTTTGWMMQHRKERYLLLMMTR